MKDDREIASSTIVLNKDESTTININDVDVVVSIDDPSFEQSYSNLTSTLLLSNSRKPCIVEFGGTAFIIHPNDQDRLYDTLTDYVVEHLFLQPDELDGLTVASNFLDD